MCPQIRYEVKCYSCGMWDDHYDSEELKLGDIVCDKVCHVCKENWVSVIEEIKD